MFSKRIPTDISSLAVKERLSDSTQFTCAVHDEDFELRENLAFHTLVLHPVIKGCILEQDGKATVDVSLELIKRDKIANVVFGILCLLVSVFMGIFTQDILMFVGVLFSCGLLAIIELFYYGIVCFFATRKLTCLLA